MQATIRVSSLALLVLVGSAGLYGQPVLTESDFMGIGDAAVRERYQGPIDVSDFTSQGPMGIWDFTGISRTLLFTDELNCLPPSAGGPPPPLSDADRTIRVTSYVPGMSDPLPFLWEYYSYGVDGRTLYGLVIDGPPALVVAASPPPLDVPLPLAFGEAWTEQYDIGLFPIINRIHSESTVDAWGPATLPGIGTVECLRATREITNVLLDISVDPPVQLGTLHTRSYSWYARGVDVVAVLTTPIDPVAVPPPGFASADSVSLFIDHTPQSNVTEFVRGDVDGDGTYDLSDAIEILSSLFQGREVDCATAADLDDDGTLAVDDAVLALNHLFLGGPAPTAPYPSCGTDPTPDLDCAITGCP